MKFSPTQHEVDDQIPRLFAKPNHALKKSKIFMFVFTMQNLHEVTCHFCKTQFFQTGIGQFFVLKRSTQDQWMQIQEAIASTCPQVPP